jgi:hypothetical protein
MTQKGQEALTQYIIRNPFSVNKLHYQQKTGQVKYRSTMIHGKNKQNFEIFQVINCNPGNRNGVSAREGFGAI